jgi:hypothetical protein
MFAASPFDVQFLFGVPSEVFLCLHVCSILQHSKYEFVYVLHHKINKLLRFSCDDHSAVSEHTEHSAFRSETECFTVRKKPSSFSFLL